MGSEFTWQLAFALVLPLLVPIIGAMLMANLAARKRLKMERIRALALVHVANGRRLTRK